MFKNGKFVFKVSKHAAERIYQRSDDLQDVLRSLEKVRQDILLHVYLCLVQGMPQKVVVGNYTFVLHFNEVTQDMVLKTFWVNTITSHKHDPQRKALCYQTK